MSEGSGWQSEGSCSSESSIGYDAHEQDSLSSPRLRREVQGIKESLLRSIQECNERSYNSTSTSADSRSNASILESSGGDLLSSPSSSVRPGDLESSFAISHPTPHGPLLASTQRQVLRESVKGVDAFLASLSLPSPSPPPSFCQPSSTAPHRAQASSSSRGQGGRALTRKDSRGWQDILKKRQEAAAREAQASQLLHVQCIQAQILQSQLLHAQLIEASRQLPAGHQTYEAGRQVAPGPGLEAHLSSTSAAGATPLGDVPSGALAISSTGGTPVRVAVAPAAGAPIVDSAGAEKFPRLHLQGSRACQGSMGAPAAGNPSANGAGAADVEQSRHLLSNHVGDLEVKSAPCLNAKGQQDGSFMQHKGGGEAVLDQDLGGWAGRRLPEQGVERGGHFSVSGEQYSSIQHQPSSMRSHQSPEGVCVGLVSDAASGVLKGGVERTVKEMRTSSREEKREGFASESSSNLDLERRMKEENVPTLANHHLQVRDPRTEVDTGTTPIAKSTGFGGGGRSVSTADGGERAGRPFAIGGEKGGGQRVDGGEEGTGSAVVGVKRGVKNGVESDVRNGDLELVEVLTAHVSDSDGDLAPAAALGRDSDAEGKADGLGFPGGGVSTQRGETDVYSGVRRVGVDGVDTSAAAADDACGSTTGVCQPIGAVVVAADATAMINHGCFSAQMGAGILTGVHDLTVSTSALVLDDDQEEEEEDEEDEVEIDDDDNDDNDDDDEEEEEEEENDDDFSAERAQDWVMHSGHLDSTPEIPHASATSGSCGNLSTAGHEFDPSTNQWAMCGDNTTDASARSGNGSPRPQGGVDEGMDKESRAGETALGGGGNHAVRDDLVDATGANQAAVPTGGAGSREDLVQTTPGRAGVIKQGGGGIATDSGPLTPRTEYSRRHGRDERNQMQVSARKQVAGLAFDSGERVQRQVEAAVVGSDAGVAYTGVATVESQAGAAKLGVDSPDRLASAGIHSPDRLASAGIHSPDRLASAGIHSPDRLASAGIHSPDRLASTEGFATENGLAQLLERQSDAPLQSSGAPLQPSDAPHRSSDAPLQSGGAPLQSSDASLDPRGGPSNGGQRETQTLVRLRVTSEGGDPSPTNGAQFEARVWARSVISEVLGKILAREDASVAQVSDPSKEEADSKPGASLVPESGGTHHDTVEKIEESDGEGTILDGLDASEACGRNHMSPRSSDVLGKRVGSPPPDGLRALGTPPPTIDRTKANSGGSGELLVNADAASCTKGVDALSSSFSAEPCGGHDAEKVVNEAQSIAMLRSERDALRAERDELLVRLDGIACERESERNALVDRIIEIADERDALLARIDAISGERDALLARIDAISGERRDAEETIRCERDEILAQREFLAEKLCEREEVWERERKFLTASLVSAGGGAGVGEALEEAPALPSLVDARRGHGERQVLALQSLDVDGGQFSDGGDDDEANADHGYEHSRRGEGGAKNGDIELISRLNDALEDVTNRCEAAMTPTPEWGHSSSIAHRAYIARTRRKLWTQERNSGTDDEEEDDDNGGFVPHPPPRRRTQGKVAAQPVPLSTIVNRRHSSREKERKVGWMGGAGEAVSEAGILLARLKELHKDMRSYVMDE